MIYGYTRVSTELQNTENQKHEIQTFAEANKITINKWVNEVISSRKSLKERQLSKLLKHLKKGDILIVAGKGHETGQYINGKIFHFSDHEEVLKNL